MKIFNKEENTDSKEDTQTGAENPESRKFWFFGGKG